MSIFMFLGDHGPNSIHKYRNFFVNLQVTSPELERAVLDVSVIIFYFVSQK